MKMVIPNTKYYKCIRDKFVNMQKVKLSTIFKIH